MSDLAVSQQYLEPTAKKFAQSRKRFQRIHSPRLLVGADGMIEHISPLALRMLEYSDAEAVPSCFFTHVHNRNIYQVMRDVADMVCYGKSRATWLLRLRTGRNRWRWFRVAVRNGLRDETGGIELLLSDVGDLQG